MTSIGNFVGELLKKPESIDSLRKNLSNSTLTIDWKDIATQWTSYFNPK